MVSVSRRLLAPALMLGVFLSCVSALTASGQDGTGSSMPAGARSPATRPQPVKALNKADLVYPAHTTPEEAAAPGNDNMAAALTIASLPFQHSIDTSAATVEVGEPQASCTSGANSNSVWYRYTATYTGGIDVTTYGSNYDTVLAVYQGTPNAATQVGCNDDGYADGTSGLRLWVSQGLTYYIAAADYGGPGGGNLVFSILPSPITYVRNEYIGFHSLAQQGAEGLYTIGTTGGDPLQPNDDNKRLLYGFPLRFGTSYTTMRVESSGTVNDYRLGYDVEADGASSVQGSTVTTQWTVQGVRVIQRIKLAETPDTGRQDSVLVEYEITNLARSTQEVGLRLLIDTMIGDNDGAPLFVPGVGRVEHERLLGGGALPTYWIAWESPTFAPALLKARGLLGTGQATMPDSVIIGRWGDDLCGTPGLADSPWSYTPNEAYGIACDSAVALYYDVQALAPNQTRRAATYYGLAREAGGLNLAPDVNAYMEKNLGVLEQMRRQTGNMATAGDYFLDKMGSDAVKLSADAVLAGFEVGSLGIDWSLIARGFGHIATPGYKAALHASWRGWANDAAQRHWAKGVYDFAQNNTEWAARRILLGGLRYIGKDIAQAGTTEAVTALTGILLSVPDPVQDQFGQRMLALLDGYAEDLRREQDAMLLQLAVQPLSEAQVRLYRLDLAARAEANTQIAGHLALPHDFTWDAYRDAEAADAQWWRFLGPIALKYGVIIVATYTLDGPGFYLASLGTTVGYDLIYQGAENARNIARDYVMFVGTLQWLTGRLSMATQQVSLNTVNGFNLIRSSTPPELPELSVRVESMRSYGHYRLWPMFFWAEHRAEMGLAVHNLEQYETTVTTSADFLHNDFIWNDSRRIFMEGSSLFLEHQNDSGVAYIPLKLPDSGESPKEFDDVDVLVLAATGTGIYPGARFTVPWSAERVEEDAQTATVPAPFTAVAAASAPALPYPLVTSITALPRTTQYVLVLSLRNPFTLEVQAEVSQLVAAPFSIVDSGGAGVNDRRLTWNQVMAPQSALQLTAVLSWNGSPGTVAELPAAELVFAGTHGEGGDTYAGEPHAVRAAWPLTVSYDIPQRWMINSTAPVTVALTNLLPGEALAGVVRLRLVAPAGETLASAQEPVTLVGGGARTIAVELAIPSAVGYAQLISEVTIGAETRTVVSETVLLEGFRSLLPLLRR